MSFCISLPLWGSACPQQCPLCDCLQVLSFCNSSLLLRQACPQLALACLTASVRQLELLQPDQLATIAFLSSQTNLRLNLVAAEQLKRLVKAGVARATAMSALSLTQFVYGAVSIGGVRQAQMKVRVCCCWLPLCEGAHDALSPYCSSLRGKYGRSLVVLLVSCVYKVL